MNHVNISKSLSEVSSLLSRLMNKEGLSHKTAIVLIHLSSEIFYNEGKVSNQLLSKKAKLHERTITTSLNYLEYKNFISINNERSQRIIKLLRVDIFIEELE